LNHLEIGSIKFDLYFVTRISYSENKTKIRMKNNKKIVFLILLSSCLISCGIKSNSENDLRIPVSLYFHPEVLSEIKISGSDQDVFSSNDWSITLDNQISFEIDWSSYESSLATIYLPSEFSLIKESSDEIIFKTDHNRSLEVFIFDSIPNVDTKKYLLSDFKSLVDLCHSKNNCFSKKKVANLFSYKEGRFISSYSHEVRSSKDLIVLSFLGVLNKELIYCRYEAPYEKDSRLKDMLKFSSVLNFIKVKGKTTVPMLSEIISSEPIIF
ncbi:MAG: hypothetical protein AB8F74_20915, partial [Saprospiraceae bacterium]